MEKSNEVVNYYPETSAQETKLTQCPNFYNIGKPPIKFGYRGRGLIEVFIILSLSD